MQTVYVCIGYDAHALPHICVLSVKRLFIDLRYFYESKKLLSNETIREIYVDFSHKWNRRMAGYIFGRHSPDHLIELAGDFYDFGIV